MTKDPLTFREFCPSSELGGIGQEATYAHTPFTQNSPHLAAVRTPSWPLVNCLLLVLHLLEGALCWADGSDEFGESDFALGTSVRSSLPWWQGLPKIPSALSCGRPHLSLLHMGGWLDVCHVEILPAFFLSEWIRPPSYRHFQEPGVAPEGHLDQ